MSLANKLALVGRDIGYSLSPEIHEFSAALMGIKASYKLIDLENHDLSELPQIVLKEKLLGFNITKPFKTDICQVFDSSKNGSVNTAVFRDSSWKFYSTDFGGFYKALSRASISLNRHRTIIFMGAGGSVSSIVDGIFSLSSKEELAVEKIYVLSRSQSFAVGKENWGTLNIVQKNLNPEVFGQLSKTNPDSLIIQCTPLPQQGDNLSAYSSMLERSFSGSIYDLTYSCDNMLLDRARDMGCKSADGLSMLIEQALESQQIWWGRSAPYEKVFEHLQSVIGKKIRDEF